MLKKVVAPLLLLVALALALAACGGGEQTTETAQDAAPAGAGPVVTVFRPPT